LAVKKLSGFVSEAVPVFTFSANLTSLELTTQFSYPLFPQYDQVCSLKPHSFPFSPGNVILETHAIFTTTLQPIGIQYLMLGLRQVSISKAAFSCVWLLDIQLNREIAAQGNSPYIRSGKSR
jgi:hypothetical protein